MIYAYKAVGAFFDSLYNFNKFHKNAYFYNVFIPLRLQLL